MINTTKILSYPNDVTYNDGHYLLFKIFERPGVEYTSPYTDVNIPTQIQNKNALAARGEYSKEREAIRAKLNRSNNKGLKEIVSKFHTTFGKEFSSVRSKRYSAFQGRGKAAKDKLVGNICLYTPPQVSVSYKTTYETENISMIGAVISSVGKVLGSGSFGEGFEALGEESYTLLQKVVAGTGQFAGTGGAQQALFGSAVNRNFADVIFTGVEFRTFTFEYSFMPSNPKEAKDVAEIVDMFSYYSLPLRRQDVAMTYELPAEFELRYMYYGNKNRYIHPALALGLESVDIKYGGEKFATFRDNEKGAQPVRTDLTLTFRELEIADRHSIYGDAVSNNWDDFKERESFDKLHNVDDGNAGNDMPPG